MPKKEVVAEIQLLVRGGQATPAPPVGPALGAKGVNIMEFCKKFNAVTQDKQGKLLPVIVRVYNDRSFDFIIKSPPVSEMLKEAAKIKKGSGEPNRVKVATIGWDVVEQIAKEKMQDMNANDLYAAMRMVAGTARSMGVFIQGTPPWEKEEESQSEAQA